MHAYVLLDRTGSMQSIWDEALSSVNVYARGLAADGAADAHVTLAMFDAQNGLQYDVLRDAVPAATWSDVTSAEATPRGMTPLYDAIGRTIALAESAAPARAVLVIMTDGQENASRELKKQDVKAALDRIEAKGWQVVFLGAEFAKFDDANAVGVSHRKQMAMASGKMGPTMQRLAEKSRAYFASGADVDFNADDRVEADEADVRKRKGR
ncbi:MAG: VWA domain-containing protein [Hyphomonadaceae bacterium]|nr:VWA domain-containing protein [Hyphomonadaceae bacterium]